MNWIGFAIIAWVFAGLEVGLKDALQLGHTGIAPSFVFSLLVFVAVSAPGPTAHWAALVLGLVMDLTWTVAVKDGRPPATILGPYALGFLLASQFIITMRPLMNRRNPLSMAFLAVTGSIIAQLVIVAFYTLRATYGDPILWDATGQLLTRLASSFYTGATALVLSLLLLPFAGFLGFQPRQQARFGRRA